MKRLEGTHLSSVSTIWRSLERQAELKRQEQERERLAKERFERDLRNAK